MNSSSGGHCKTQNMKLKFHICTSSGGQLFVDTRRRRDVILKNAAKYCYLNLSVVVSSLIFLFTEKDRKRKHLSYL